MRYRIPELDDIGKRIETIVQERNPAVRVVQISPYKDVKVPTKWNNAYRHIREAEYMAFVAVPPGKAYLCKVDIAKGVVVQTYGK